MGLSFRNPVSSLQELFMSTFNMDREIPKYYVEDVDYVEPWKLEKSVDLDGWLQWFHENSAISIYISIFYLAAVFHGQNLMRDRKPFVLRNLLVAWNLSLAVFSILGFTRLLPEALHILSKENGIYSSVCSRAGHNRASAFWGLMFTFSKVVELGDTAFSVLRKRPITPLAWIHHSATLIMVFLSYSSLSTTVRWYTIMNYFVHSLMYPYFAFKMLNVQFPRIIPMTITFFQLFQMIIGFSVATYGLYAKLTNLPCVVPTFHIYGFPLLYGGFIYLFGNLFYNSYIRRKPTKNVKKE